MRYLYDITMTYTSYISCSYMYMHAHQHILYNYSNHVAMSFTVPLGRSTMPSYVHVSLFDR